MRYVSTYQETAQEMRQREGPGHAATYWGAWNAYIGTLSGAGIVVSGNGLQPPHASTTVHLRDGRRHAQDGPYADTREHLVGYFIIGVPSLDGAMEWAPRAPCTATGCTEVRPVLPPPPHATPWILQAWTPPSGPSASPTATWWTASHTAGAMWRPLKMRWPKLSPRH
jgi:hypothetical protein